MCHAPDSRPPAPPRQGEVGNRGALALTAADGTEFSAAHALPAGGSRVGVVVLLDIRGLHPYYVALTERFAEAGVAAVGIDWFGRTAGLCGDAGVRNEDLDWQAHIPRTTAEGIDADVTAAVAALRERTDPGLPVVAVGFCFGGSNAWRLAAGDLDLAGCAGFYGRPSMVGEAVGRARLPVVMVIAGADRATPVAEQLELADELRAAGAEVDAVVYDGAPHSFFDRASGEWEDACRDAWQHVLALTDRVPLPGRPPPRLGPAGPPSAWRSGTRVPPPARGRPGADDQGERSTGRGKTQEGTGWRYGPADGRAAAPARPGPVLRRRAADRSVPGRARVGGSCPRGRRTEPGPRVRTTTSPGRRPRRQPPVPRRRPPGPRPR